MKYYVGDEDFSHPLSNGYLRQGTIQTSLENLIWFNFSQ